VILDWRGRWLFRGGGVFYEVGGRMEVMDGVLVGGGDDGEGGEEEMEGNGGSDEDGCGLVAGAEDESGASRDGVDKMS